MKNLFLMVAIFFQGHAHATGINFSVYTYSDNGTFIPCGAKIHDTTGSNAFHYTDQNTETLTRSTSHGFSSYNEWRIVTSDVVELDELNFRLSSEKYNAAYGIFICYENLTANLTEEFNNIIYVDFGLHSDDTDDTYFSRAVPKVIVNAVCTDETGEFASGVTVIGNMYMTSGSVSGEEEIYSNGNQLSRCFLDIYVEEISWGFRSGMDITHMELFVDIQQTN